MKNIKKLMAIALVAMMFAVMTVPAMAEDERVSITISKAIDGATYSAYKLLDASVGLKQDFDCGHDSEAEHESSCYNVSYSFNPTFENILKSYTNASTLEDVIAIITTYTTAEAMSQFTHYLYKAIIADSNIKPVLTRTGADGSVTLPVGPGYWLIIESPPDKYNGATSRIIVDTTGSRNVSIEAKRQEPTLTKTVADNGVNHGDGADVAIGDDVEFLLTALIPDPVGYTQYKYIIHDSMEKGLTFKKNTVEIRIGTYDSVNSLNQTYYTVADEVGNDGTKFSISIDIKEAISDGKLKPQDKIYIRYFAVLNEAAKIYDNVNTSPDNHANKNTAYLEYSSDPYDISKTAKTQDDFAYVWTFPLTINKVDSAGKSIKGAKFVVSTDPDLNPSLNAEGTPADQNGLMGFIKSDDNTTYRVAPGVTEDTVYVLDMSETGTIKLEGFNDQIFYYLYEVAAPDGYNKLSDHVIFKFFATYDGTSPMFKEGELYVNVAMPGSTGHNSTELVADIVNRTGAELPSTGGIGTTIFYILGGVLAAGAVVFLITNKRVDDKR